MMNNIYITKIFPSPDGNILTLKIRANDEDTELRIVDNLLQNSNIPKHLDEHKKIEIDKETFAKLEKLSLYTEAIVKGIFLLSYSQNTASGIANKLYRYGFSKDVCNFAGKYLKKYGYINEELQAELLVSNLANTKHYGKGKIEKELIIKGFPKNVIDDTLEKLDVDFDEICKKRILKTIKIEDLGENEYRQKAIFKLRQYGFNMDNITKALEDIYAEE